MTRLLIPAVVFALAAPVTTFAQSAATPPAGRTGAARARLQLLRKASHQDVAEERFWYQTLEGELALANGELEKAAAARLSYKLA